MLKKMTEFVLEQKDNILWIFKVAMVILIVLLALSFIKVATYKFYQHQYMNKPIVYSEYSQISINAENWFKNYNAEKIYAGKQLNKEFVVDTCKAIDAGLYTFTWDYKSTCREVLGYGKAR